MEITFLTEKNVLRVPLHSFQEAKVESGQKLTQLNNKKTTLKVLLFFLHVKSKL